MEGQNRIIGKIVSEGIIRYGKDERKVIKIDAKGISDTKKCGVCQSALQEVTVKLVPAIIDGGPGISIDTWWCPKCMKER
jgi:hypothetical protein